jgi:hypothetical protein
LLSRNERADAYKHTAFCRHSFWLGGEQAAEGKGETEFGVALIKDRSNAVFVVA